MKQYALFLLVAVGVLSSVGCKSTKTKATMESHNSENSLDVVGEYYGKTSCKDCEAMLTKVELKDDKSYVISTMRQGKDKMPTIQTGRYEWSKKGNAITLINKNDASKNISYMVGENQLILLDSKGNKKEDGRLIIHNPNDIANRKWRLIELNGKAITTDKIPFLEFDASNTTVSGNLGCNRGFGPYTISEGNRIKFGTIKSTLMTCPNIEVETAFTEMLTRVDNYSIQGNTMTLNKARMAPLAKFEYDFFK